ncbi:hypothetical protein KA078_03075 [Candidatus Woesebacteria bacterium]|nr:hypothetical protein [Candidatus Woesebacteria bacterium]
MTIQQITAHPITLILAVVVSILLYISLDKSAHKATNSSAYVQTLEEQKNDVATEVAQLQQQFTLAQSPFTQEKILRDELLLQKSDEVILQLPALPISVEKNIESTKNLTPWQEWMSLVLK